MKNGSLGLVFLGSLGLVGACGSNNAADVTTAGCVTPAATGCKVFVDDSASFVRWAGPVTDAIGGGTSSAVVKHTPGKFCMSGVADSGPTGAGWGVLLHLGLSDVAESTGGAMVVAPFNAPALGIKELRLTLDNPPLAGVLPQATQMQSADCRTIPDCIRSFSLTTGIASPGLVTIPLADFTQADADHPRTTLDQTLITGLQFYVPPLPGMATPYDFCLRDVAFLDAAGREIRP